MSNAALQSSHPSLYAVGNARGHAHAPFDSISLEVALLGFTLGVLQVLDGVLTGIGVAHFGATAEGNVLLRTLMESIGYLPALVVSKSVALAVVVTLCVLSAQVKWLPKALKSLILLYLVGAILPWTWIILTRVI